VRHRVGRRERLRRAFEIEIELRVWEARRELFGELERERSLADAALSLQTGDRRAAALDLAREFVEFFLASCEIARRGGELVQRVGDVRGGRDVVASDGNNIATRVRVLKCGSRPRSRRRGRG
jgi:hypothetical protein